MLVIDIIVLVVKVPNYRAIIVLPKTLIPYLTGDSVPFIKPWLVKREKVSFLILPVFDFALVHNTTLYGHLIQKIFCFWCVLYFLHTHIYSNWMHTSSLNFFIKSFPNFWFEFYFWWFGLNMELKWNVFLGRNVGIWTSELVPYLF